MVRNSRSVEDRAKRLMDVTLALAALVVLSPLMLVVAAVVRIVDGPPVLFRQQRPGRGGLPFTILKFRTMRSPKPGEIAHATDELRVTPLGRLLRSTSLDELPELWNVLRGDMSLVGPRPLLMEYLDVYTPEQHRRHDVRPGFTSWAAVNGRHVLRFEDRLALDTWYVDNRSLALDLRILAITAAQVLRRTDVRTTQSAEEVGFPLPGHQHPTARGD